MNRGKDFSVAGSSTGNAAILFSEEVRAGDEVASVQISNAGTTVTITYECSNDGTNWIVCPGVPVGYATTPTPASTSTTAGINIFMIQTRFFRARISTAGSGTVAGNVMFGVGWLK